MACNTCGTKCSCGPVRMNYEYTVCPGSEPCDTVLSTACVRYHGDTLADFPLAYGDRLSRFLQTLLLKELDPVAFAGVDSIHAPYWIESVSKSDTTLTVQWQKVTDTFDWTVSYSIDNATWTNITGVDSVKTSYQLINLTPNTTYYIKVASTINGGGLGPFYSVTIKVSTNA